MLSLLLLLLLLPFVSEARLTNEQTINELTYLLPSLHNCMHAFPVSIIFYGEMNKESERFQCDE